MVVVRARDVVIAAAAGLAQAAGVAAAARNGADGISQPDAVAYALVVLSAAALLWRRRWPVAVIVVALASTIAYFALGYTHGPAFIALMVALVTAVWTGHRTAAWSLGVSGLAIYLVVLLLRSSERPSIAFLVAHVAWLLVVLLGAEIVRVQRERIAEARRQQFEEQRRQASEERLAIARELHDVVAHSMSVINVQAGIALHLRDDLPRALETLATIRKVSADALIELKQTLDVLRGDAASPRRPMPDVHALDDLVGQAEAAGLSVELDIGGHLTDHRDRRLPTAVAQAAYRIIQESVTNVIRHSGSQGVRIEVYWADGRLELAVLDRGHGFTAPVAGNGLRGMRERVDALGGELSVSPRPGGGCAVRAWLPAPLRESMTSGDDDG